MVGRVFPWDTEGRRLEREHAADDALVSLCSERSGAPRTKGVPRKELGREPGRRACHRVLGAAACQSHAKHQLLSECFALPEANNGVNKLG